MTNKKRIFIGVPCFGDPSAMFLEDFSRFIYHCGRRMPEYDFFLGIKTKSEQFRARNAIVEAAMQVGADWLLMLDDDMVCDIHNTMESGTAQDFLRKLLSHGKSVCGVLYYQRGGECSPVVMMKRGSGYRFLRDDELTGGLQEVDVAGGGCLLIDMKLFYKMKPPFFAPEHDFGTDIQLCKRAQEMGESVWIDSSIELGHIKSERAVVSSRTRHVHQTHDTLPGDEKTTFILNDVYDRLEQDAEDYTGFSKLQMAVAGNRFMDERANWTGSDLDWYKEYPLERVSRQVWFNTDSQAKRGMTEFILKSISHTNKLEIMEFGCGIGIPSLYLAQRGHKVTAMDVDGTGTLEFLKWRVKKYGVPVNIEPTSSDVPNLNGHKFDVVIAMDVLEHIQDWKGALKALAVSMKEGGALFSNNAILDDDSHPEHYHIDHKEFLSACVEFDLYPINQITYMKRSARNA